MTAAARSDRSTDPDSNPSARLTHWQRLIAGAVAEVDPNQIAILRQLTPAQRFQQMQSMIELVEGVAAYRLRQRQPELSDSESLRIIRRRDDYL